MKFALIGMGYVSQRHLKAIKDTGNDLIAVLDPHDSVGILDSYFPECQYFKSTERFDRFITKNPVDYISICSPNYLHEYHCKMSLRLGANVICEKPLVLCDWNLKPLEDLEIKTGKTIYGILQLRLHPQIIDLKNKIKSGVFNLVQLKYITPRGPWYNESWKGDIKKSGGIETNIGIHFFDMLLWLFGKVEKIEIISKNEKTVIGNLKLEKGNVEWTMSIDRNMLPNKDLKFYRSIIVNNEEIRFDDIFGDLHTLSYKEIFNGNGFRINDMKPSIELVTKLRDMK